MNEFKKLLFIINKYSGKGFQPHVEGRILDACEKNDVECTIEFTKSRGHATELAKNGIGKYDAIIAVGGDGTVNEVAQGLVDSDQPMGIIPKGSGNGLARHLQIPLKLSRSVQTLFKSEIQTMDTFLLNGKLSVNVSGIGFDGHVANLFGKNKKRGFWGYAKLVIREYVRFKEFDTDFMYSNQAHTFKNNFIVAIANSSQYGNNARVSPQASVTDQLLHVARIKKVAFHRGFRFAFLMFTRKLRDNDLYESFTLKDGVITTAQPVAYHIDGEPCGTENEFCIVLKPSSLKILTPLKQNNKSRI